MTPLSMCPSDVGNSMCSCKCSWDRKLCRQTPAESVLTDSLLASWRDMSTMLTQYLVNALQLLNNYSPWPAWQSLNLNSLCFQMKWSGRLYWHSMRNLSLSLVLCLKCVMIILLCSHVSYFFLWAAQHTTAVHKYQCSHGITTAGRSGDCSSSLKCAQQLCLIHNSHYAFFIQNSIFPGSCFFNSIKYLTLFFRIWSATENFIVKARFSLFFPCLSSICSIAIDSYSGDQKMVMRAAGIRPSSWNATLHVESAYCRCQNAFYQLYHEDSFHQISTQRFPKFAESLWRGKFGWHKTLRNRLTTYKRMCLILLLLTCIAWEAQIPLTVWHWHTSRRGCWLCWWCWWGSLIWTDACIGMYWCKYWIQWCVYWSVTVLVLVLVCQSACIGLYWVQTRKARHEGRRPGLRHSGTGRSGTGSLWQAGPRPAVVWPPCQCRVQAWVAADLLPQLKVCSCLGDGWLGSRPGLSQTTVLGSWPGQEG